MSAFAERGFLGTPTTEIAKAAGISQAYLFRLFPTKSDLVLAVDRALQRAHQGGLRRSAAPGARRRRGPQARRWARPTAHCSRTARC